MINFRNETQIGRTQLGYHSRDSSQIPPFQHALGLEDNLDSNLIENARHKIMSDKTIKFQLACLLFVSMR
jgi:hypothetical protein